MSKAKFVAYLRVSTDKQGERGLGIEAQRTAINQFLNGGNWQVVGEFVEVESGRRNDRPALAAAMHAAKVHGAKLCIAKLDRLARSVSFISALMDSGIEFVCCDMPFVDRFSLHVLAAVAEKEARDISIRTKAAMAEAKRRGVKMGTPENLLGHGHKGPVASATKRAAKADGRAADLRIVIHDIEAKGTTSLRGIAFKLNERGIPAARGGSWSPAQVMRLVRRLDAQQPVAASSR